MRGRKALIGFLVAVGCLGAATGPAPAQELQCKSLKGTKAIAAILAHQTVNQLGSLPCGVEAPVADRCEVTEVTGISTTSTTSASLCNRTNYAAQCRLAAADFDSQCETDCADYTKKIAMTTCKGLGSPKTPTFSGNCPPDPENPAAFIVACTVTGTCVCDP